MIVIKNLNEDVILGTDGEEAIASALKHFVFHTGNEKALNVLKFIDPYWVSIYEKEKI